MWLALSIETTTFWTANNIANLLRQTAFIAILAIGQTFVIITGGIDLSVGAVEGFISMIVALLLTNDLGFASTITGAVTISLLIGVGIGLFHAFGVVQMGLPPFIMTLSTMYALRGIGLLITNGATISITNDTFTNFSRTSVSRLSMDGRELVPDSFPGVDGRPGGRSVSRLSQSQPLGTLSIRDRVEQGGSAALRRQRQGDHLYRLCSRARCSPPLSACCWRLRIGIGNPTQGQGDELQSIASSVIGGASLFGAVGSVHGPVIGALILQTISNGANLLNVNSFWQTIITGALIIIVVYFDSLRRRKR